MGKYMNYLIVKCNNCGKTFFEHSIIYDGDEDKEFCPECGEAGSLMDCINLSNYWSDEIVYEKMAKGNFVAGIVSPLCKYFDYTRCDYILAFDDNWEGFIGEYVRVFLNETNVFSVNVTATNKRGILASVIKALDTRGNTDCCTRTKYKNFVILKEVI